LQHHAYFLINGKLKSICANIINRHPECALVGYIIHNFGWRFLNVYFVINAYNLRVVEGRMLKEIRSVKMVAYFYVKPKFFFPFTGKAVNCSFAPIKPATWKFCDQL